MICAPGGCAFQIVCDGGGVDVGCIHLGLQRAELGQRDVAGAAFGRCLFAGRRIGGAEWLAAFGSELRLRENVGCGVQVALGVPADQLPILGERHVALDDTGAHACSSLIGLLGMLGKLQRRTAMAD